MLDRFKVRVYVCVCWEKRGGDVVWAVAWPLVVVVVVAAASCMCGGVREDLKGLWMDGCCSSGR